MKSLIYIRESIRKFLNNDEEKFKIGMGLKFFGVSVICTISVLLFTYLLIRIDLMFFVSHGFPGAQDFKIAFVDFIYSSLFDQVPWICLSAVFVFGLGYYLSTIMIRPFKVIGEHCENIINNNEKYYSPDFFSDLKLLTTFSVFFFSSLDEGAGHGKFKGMSIPNHFTRIHKPKFEKSFFFNYLFIITIFALMSSLGIIAINLEVREQITELARRFLQGNEQAMLFLNEQFIIADIAVYYFVTLHLFLYLLLGVHMYSKVATPAFAVFATMRSFLKGNFHNRVHLIGYYYLRNDCRKINKYLEYVQKNLT